jgi:hypothetical protein
MTRSVRVTLTGAHLWLDVPDGVPLESVKRAVEEHMLAAMRFLNVDSPPEVEVRDEGEGFKIQENATREFLRRAGVGC